MPVRSNTFLNGKEMTVGEAWLVRLTSCSRVYHGDLDDLIPVRASQDMVEALEKAGAVVKLTRYPNLLHDCWSAAYGSLEVYRWMFSCRRAAKSDDIVVPGASKPVVVE